MLCFQSNSVSAVFWTFLFLKITTIIITTFKSTRCNHFIHRNLNERRINNLSKNINEGNIHMNLFLILIDISFSKSLYSLIKINIQIDLNIDSKVLNIRIMTKKMNIFSFELDLLLFMSKSIKMNNFKVSVLSQNNFKLGRGAWKIHF